MADSSDGASAPLPVGVRRKTGRGGRVYHYLETDGGLVPIKGAPGSDEFRRSLAEAERRRSRTPRLTRFDSLIGDFLGSPEHKRTRPSTRALREIALRKIAARFGEFAVIDFNRRAIRRDIFAFRNDLAETPRMADVCIETLSRLLNWAYDQGAEIEVNHARGVESLAASGARADIVWSDDERWRFCAEAEPAIAEAIMALYYSAARVGDAAAWTPAQYDGRWLSFMPAKTARSTALEVHLPAYLLPPFKELLDRCAARRGPTLLLTKTGRHWKRTYLSERIIDERRRIFGDLDRHAHDMRGTTSTKLIDAGCTDREVAAITGHVTAEALADRARSLSAYVKRTRQQAINAYTKWYAAEFAPKGDVVQFPKGA